MLQQFSSNTFCHKSAIMGQKSDIYTSLIYLGDPNYITGQRCTVEILHSNFAFISGSLHNLEARGAFHETACCVVSSAERNQIQPKSNSSKHFLFDSGADSFNDLETRSVIIKPTPVHLT